MHITFERATLDDAEAILATEIAAFHHDAVMYPGVPLSGPPGYDSIDTLRTHIAQRDTYAIRVDGQIVGGMVVIDEGAEHCHLDLLFIDPAFHNRGIGTQALHFLDRSYTTARWTLDTPGYALRNQHVYEKFGFVKVKEETFPNIVLFGYEKHV